MPQAAVLNKLSFGHYGDKDQYEVDAVIEDRSGDLVGIEVKASAMVSSTDFRGLQRLAESVGENSKMGLVLYDHDRSVPFGERLWAAPLSCLWSLSLGIKAQRDSDLPG